MEESKITITLIYLLLISIAVAALIFLSVKLVKNIDIIKSDPLSYGMNVHNFSSCSCIDGDGKNWNSFDGGFIYRDKGEGWINYSELPTNFSFEKIGNKWDSMKS